METIAAGAEHAAPAGLPSLSGDAAALTGTRRPRTRWVLAAVLLPVALTALVLMVPAGTISAAFRDTRWEFVPALAVLSVLHYVFAALALRGASGHRLPLLETTLAQFTAAAANRVTPSGLGAVAVNTRYLVCHGIPLTRAVVAVGVMQVAGVPADLILMVAVLAIGRDGRMLDAMGTHAAQAAELLPPGPALAVIAVVSPALLLWGRRAARSALMGRAVEGLRDLSRRPSDLALTLAASAATTFVLGLAFALSVQAIPATGASPDDTLPLLAAYLIGAAAASAIPSPGGVGSTEAALVAALAALGIAAAPALQAVLLFRVITFWAPVPVGLLTCRTLRDRRPTFTK